MNIRVETAFNSALAGSAGTTLVQAKAPLRNQPVFGLYRAHGKRALDLLFVLLAAPAVILVTTILALCIMTDGKMPFYAQSRVGKNGRVFRMWKLRSMVPNAEKILADYLLANPVASAEWNRDQKLKHDPRITKFGRLIRATSMDELPQLFNVLIGQMSLVGPRPMMCSQRTIYPGTEYYAMRPGITGYWQTSVRNESSFRQRASFDADYYADLSLITDLKIVAKTFGVVLRATGH